MTRLKQLVALAALLLPISMHAQEKITAKPVSAQSATSLSNIFKKYALYEINTVDLDLYMKQGGAGNIPLELNLPGFASFPMNLQAHDILSNNYKLVVGTPQGGQEFPKPACMTYQGVLTNQGSSSVYLTITKDLIYGMLNGRSQSWFIEPLQYFDKQANGNVYVVYDTKDVLPRTGISCGVSEIQTRHITDNAAARVEGTATGTGKLVEVAIASDDSMYIRYSTAARVQEHNIAVMNTVEGLYGNTQLAGQYLEFKIVGQYVSAALANNALTPLYTGQDATVLLPNFAAWGQAGHFGFTYDMATYWTTKDITDNAGNTGVIGLAYTGAVCSSFKYQILEDLAGLDGSQLGSLQAHETGHNFGANHDASGAPYIMAPAVSNPAATTFSAASITSINTFLSQPSVNCLSPSNAIIPVAQFNASTPSICTGSSITFTDYSVGQVSGVSWTFQGGTPATSTNRSETVTFSSPGLKTITLTATNANGTNTISKSVFVANSTHNTAGCHTTYAGVGSDYGLLQSFQLLDLKYIPASLFIGNIYYNYTCNNMTVLQPNTTYTAIANIGSEPDNWQNKLQVFIDYNNDGDFGDANEIVYFSPSCLYGVTQFTFTTPATIPIMDAYLRMRIETVTCSTPPSIVGCGVPDNSSTIDFSVFFSSSTALPLLLTDFDGYYNNGKNELNWTTETEVETDHFIVERSTDGSKYVEVGNIPARGLTNTLTNYYQFTDALLNAQNVKRFYYRLKMVDKDGAYKYTKTVITTRPDGNDRVQVLVYPNPVLRNTTLQIKKATNERSVIEIYNSMGQKVFTKRLTAALFNTTVDIPANWGAGIYIIRITDNKESWSGSVLIK